MNNFSQERSVKVFSPDSEKLEEILTYGSHTKGIGPNTVYRQVIKALGEQEGMKKKIHMSTSSNLYRWAQKEKTVIGSPVVLLLVS